jgi:hypothetical protein
VDDIDQNVIDEVKENSEFSVFAFLWWFLFGLLLFLKIFSYLARNNKK